MQTELQTSKTYMPNDILHNKNSNISKHKSAENIPGLRINSSRSRSLSVTPTPRQFFKIPSPEVSVTQHLEENIEKIKLESINC